MSCPWRLRFHRCELPHDRRTSRLGIVVSGFIRVDPNYNEMNWNGDFSWFERNFPWSFKVSSKLLGHPIRMCNDPRNLGIWYPTTTSAEVLPVAHQWSINLEAFRAVALIIYLTSYLVYLVEKCAIQLFDAICCNSCWDHSCNARCVVFRTCRHLIEGHCATCGLQLVLVSVTRPGSNLCMPLASVYIIGFSCFSRIEDQETSCIWSNSHSTFPSYLSGMFLLDCIRLRLYWLCMPGRKISLHSDPWSPLEWMTR